MVMSAFEDAVDTLSTTELTGGRVLTGKQSADAIRAALPYLLAPIRDAVDPDNPPARGETPAGVMRDVRAVLSRLEAEAQP